MRLRHVLCTLLAALAAVPSAGAYRFLGFRWHGETITYYGAAPDYNWSVATAALAWNASGARIRFAHANSAAGADVVIRSRALGGRSLGLATTSGDTAGRLHSVVTIVPGLTRWQAALTAVHELGHVLGLDHEDALCAAMNSVGDTERPAQCDSPPPGSWWCRMLSADDLRGVVALYGGRVAAPRGPTFCAK